MKIGCSVLLWKSAVLSNFENRLFCPVLKIACFSFYFENRLFCPVLKIACFSSYFENRLFYIVLKIGCFVLFWKSPVLSCFENRLFHPIMKIGCFDLFWKSTVLSRSHIMTRLSCCNCDSWYAMCSKILEANLFTFSILIWTHFPPGWGLFSMPCQISPVAKASVVQSDRKRPDVPGNWFWKLHSDINSNIPRVAKVSRTP